MTNDYLSFYSSFSGYAPITLLALFFLTMARVIPLIVLAPFLGSKLPGGVKVGLAISLTTIILPTVMLKSSTFVTFDTAYLGYLLKEIFIGVILGFLASIPFHICESAGVLVDFIRGSSSLMVTDPIMQAQVSPLGLLYNYILIVLFFQIGGPFIFFNALLTSYSVIPPDKFMSSTFFVIQTPFFQLILHLLTQVTAISIQLAGPALVAVLMTEMFLGIANRLAPQVQISFLGMSVKSLVGIALLYVGWFFILQQAAKKTLFYLAEIDRVLLTF